MPALASTSSLQRWRSPQSLGQLRLGGGSPIGTKICFRGHRRSIRLHRWSASQCTSPSPRALINLRPGSGRMGASSFSEVYMRSRARTRCKLTPTPSPLETEYQLGLAFCATLRPEPFSRDTKPSTITTRTTQHRPGPSFLDGGFSPARRSSRLKGATIGATSVTWPRAIRASSTRCGRPSRLHLSS